MTEELLKIDIGCGKNKKEGFKGMDQYVMDGVDIVHDIRITPWPFEDSSVDEVHCSHFLEHLDNLERVAFLNELYRVMKVGAKALIITPHWASNRAYGDFTHKGNPVSEMMYYYISKEWRKTQAPHTDIEFNKDGYTCDFEAGWGYSFGPELALRDTNYQQFALANYKEAAQDLIATITKKIL